MERRLPSGRGSALLRGTGHGASWDYRAYEEADGRVSCYIGWIGGTDVVAFNSATSLSGVGSPTLPAGEVLRHHLESVDGTAALANGPRHLPAHR